MGGTQTHAHGARRAEETCQSTAPTATEGLGGERVCRESQGYGQVARSTALHFGLSLQAATRPTASRLQVVAILSHCGRQPSTDRFQHRFSGWKAWSF